MWKIRYYLDFHIIYICSGLKNINEYFHLAKYIKMGVNFRSRIRMNNHVIITIIYLIELLEAFYNISYRVWKKF